MLTLLLYSLFLGYIIVSYFPSDASDKFLLSTTKYLFNPNITNVQLLDNSKLRIDSAIVLIDSFSNKKSYKEEILFRIYFNSRHKETVPFSFKILDTLNETGGSSDQTNYKDLYLKNLKDSIKITIDQVKFNENIGWNNSKITDTVEFVRKKTQIIDQRDL